MTPDTEKKNSLIEKIKKLFAMAQRKTNNDGTSNEAEAAQAMAMAQQLLAKYNLDMRTIQDSVSADKKAEAVGGKREKTQINRSAMYRWQQTFWHELAEANFCFHWVIMVDEVRWVHELTHAKQNLAGMRLTDLQREEEAYAAGNLAAEHWLTQAAPWNKVSATAHVSSQNTKR
jgi:hypothetical protein